MDVTDDRRVDAFDSGHNVKPGFRETGPQQEHVNGGLVRGEVDTSAPFESVKEAVTRFGGVGFWKPHHKQQHSSENGIEEEFDAAKAEQHAVELANDLIVKERETLQVLKELEGTKTILEELKVKLQKESEPFHTQIEEPRDENVKNQQSGNDNLMCPSSSPGFILMELKQAKLNLTRTTNDLADIRATVETFNNMIEKERFELEKTRQRLSSNSSKVSSFQENDKENLDDDYIPRELNRLTSETEQFKKSGEVAKLEVLKSTNQIEEAKTKIKTAEIRLIAARKLEKAARASEALARSEINSLLKSENLSEGEGITLSYEEYSVLKMKAREVDEASNAETRQSDSEISNSDILKRVEEATEELKNTKTVLEDALRKVEAANCGKLKAEEALRKWRSDHGQRRKSTVQNSTKFKNSSCRTNSNTRLLDVNGAHILGSTASGPVLRPTMSIGQILSRKLLLTEEYSGKSSMKMKVSLAQMLSKPTTGGSSGGDGGDGGGKRRSEKRKKFGLGRISFLVAKPSKKKKKHSVGSRLSCGVE